MFECDFTEIQVQSISLKNVKVEIKKCFKLFDPNNYSTKIEVSFKVFNKISAYIHNKCTKMILKIWSIVSELEFSFVTVTTRASQSCIIKLYNQKFADFFTPLQKWIDPNKIRNRTFYLKNTLVLYTKLRKKIRKNLA